MARKQKSLLIFSISGDYANSVWLWVKAHVLTSVLCSLTAVTLVIAYLEELAEVGAPGANITSFGESVWWAIVTLLTVGYGDRYPVTTLGRILGSILMFSGVISVAIVTSKIASVFLEQMLLEGRRRVKTSELKNHFVVCGWRRDMAELLAHILDFNPGLEAKQLVVVCNIKAEEIETLRENTRLEHIQFVHGDFTQEILLKRAAPERARKILILADHTPNAMGVMPSATETDARTVMAAMTLAHIARGTAVTAEILDPSMEPYLKMAHVTEIIYSREYSRLLLGNATAGAGISNIIFDLLDPTTPARILTVPIEEHLIGGTYANLREHFSQTQPQSTLIGLLENTGNSYSIKEHALRKAQQTPDIQKLVDNLRSVKDIKCNHPIFSPDSSFVIPEGAMAIILKVKEARHGASELAR